MTPGPVETHLEEEGEQSAPSNGDVEAPSEARENLPPNGDNGVTMSSRGEDHEVNQRFCPQSHVANCKVRRCG